ncbi:MAG: M28 family peptidase [Xanthomonadaceae bacterium]|nr:M28 family peptidase [Xanthomonadaceae bacterium]
MRSTASRFVAPFTAVPFAAAALSVAVLSAALHAPNVDAGPLTKQAAPTAPREVRIADAALAVAADLRERALLDRTSWAVVESLTTEIGPRLAGSEADARAVRWAEAKFKALGYDKVWLEEVRFPKWVRRSERGEVVGDHAQPLTLTALGGSAGGTVEAEVVRFPDLAALEAAPAGSLTGKIAFVDFRMTRARDGSGYGPGSRVRSRGPSAAIRAGASAFLMRSAGTDSHRNPHTGITRYEEGLTPIPAAALSVPDADQLARLIALGKPLRVRVALDCGWDGTAISHNVIGEVTGAMSATRSKTGRNGAQGDASDVVVIGGHLDSWDLGTGAIDDGAGVAITMAAGHLIAKLPKAQRPPRTIRVIAFANEEQGLYGGKAYADRYAAAVTKHQIVAESDFGAGRIYAFNSNAAPHAQGAIARIAEALKPLGIERSEKGGPGPDVGPIAERGAIWGWLAQDGSDYFDLHHTPDDTLDKIDPAALAQNTAAYAVFAYLAASADGSLGSAPKPAPAPAQPTAR